MDVDRQHEKIPDKLYTKKARKISIERLKFIREEIIII
ncbi:MAG: hypothetical protein K0R06_989 [Clostridium sp.]|jgi:hypothetical protein|nr:hypothetical protein [Clostridium sp.]